MVYIFKKIVIRTVYGFREYVKRSSINCQLLALTMLTM
uniref:Uncharacterized protein n=1 Tax=Arundo donax TaxID=35708 RepID=A0A0A9A121_ARUDO